MMFNRFRRILVVGAALVLLLLAFGSATVSAQQDPQPPWEGNLVVASQRYLFNGTSLQPIDMLPQNGPGETIGIYGHNSAWVNLSPYGHMVRRDSVANIVANPAFTQGWRATDGEANPLWQGTATTSCVIMVIDDTSGVLRGSGVALTLDTTVGVYAVLGDHLQISPWLHFVARSCVSGNFPAPSSVSDPAIPAPAVMSSGQTVRTVSIEENLRGSCDEAHEIEYTQPMPDGNTLYVCKQAKILQPMGGDVLLYGMGTVVTFVSPVPGDEAIVISAWVANAAKAGAVAVGVAASVASQASSAPIGSVHVAAASAAPWVAFPDLAAVQAALTSVPMLGDEVTLEGDFSELELAAFDAAGNFITRSFDEATVMASAPASVCVLAGEQCQIVIPVPGDGELAHAIERHGAKAVTVFMAVTTHPEEVYCGSVSGRCLVTAKINGIGVGVVLYVNEGSSTLPVFGRVVTSIGGSRVKVHQIRISSCLEWRVYPPPVDPDPTYLPIPEGQGRCLERGNYQQ